jgi:hypothetical protein
MHVAYSHSAFIMLLIVVPRDRRPSTAVCPVPSLLGDEDKGNEIVYGDEKYFVLGRLEQPRQNKNVLYRHGKPNEPRKDLFHKYSLSLHSL